MVFALTALDSLIRTGQTTEGRDLLSTDLPLLFLVQEWPGQA